MHMAVAIPHTHTTVKLATLNSYRSFLAAQQSKAHLADTNVKQT